MQELHNFSFIGMILFAILIVLLDWVGTKIKNKLSYIAYVYLYEFSVLCILLSIILYALTKGGY